MRGFAWDEDGYLAWVVCPPAHLSTAKGQLHRAVTTGLRSGAHLPAWERQSRHDRVDNRRYLASVTSYFRDHDLSLEWLLRNRLRRGAHGYCSDLAIAHTGLERAWIVREAADTSVRAGVSVSFLPSVPFFLALAGELDTEALHLMTLDAPDIHAAHVARTGLTMTMGSLGWLDTAKLMGIYPRRAMFLTALHRELVHRNLGYLREVSDALKSILNTRDLRPAGWGGGVLRPRIASNLDSP